MIYRMNGYNNAVNTLNNVCKDLYSGSLGTAQSVDIEDLEMHLKSSYLNSRKGTHNVGVENHIRIHHAPIIQAYHLKKNNDNRWKYRKARYK